MESLFKCPDLWFWIFQLLPKSIPITPYYLSLDIALGIAVVGDTDSIMDCQSVQKVPSAFALYNLEREEFPNQL